MSLKYYLSQFRGYILVVFTDDECKALRRLIEYVRVRKGNLIYEECEIRKQAKILPVDMIDDYGRITKLFEIEKNMESIQKQFNEKVNDEVAKVREIRKVTRNLVDAIVDDNEDYY